MVQKGVASVKLAMEKLEHFLELGGTKKDITLLVISGIALIVSIFDLVPLPFDASWATIILCGIPIILEAVIGLVTAFDIKAAPLTYDIQTWGWTTDAVAHPLGKRFFGKSEHQIDTNIADADIAEPVDGFFYLSGVMTAMQKV